MIPDQKALEDCKRAEEYYRVAWEYLEAYKAVVQIKPDLELTSAKLFLLCHALETAMKGWLVLQEGATIRQLRNKYGHDLAKLAFSAGSYYPILLRNSKHIDRLNDSYAGSRDYEYPEGNPNLNYVPPGELAQLVEPCVQDLISSIVAKRQPA